MPERDQGMQKTTKKLNAGKLILYFISFYAFNAEFDFWNKNPHIYDQFMNEKPKVRSMNIKSPAKSKTY